MSTIAWFLITWYGAQLFMVVFLYFLSHQQGPWLLYMRDKVGRPNDLEKPLHQNNWRMMGTVSIILALPQLVYGYWYHGLVFLLLMLPFCSLCFDRMINKLEGNNPDYIGSGAETDREVLKIFGADAGHKKSELCLLAILFLNIAAMFFHP